MSGICSMKFRNPFKHRHNIDHVCHCFQICCSCGKHLWQIIRDTEKKIDKKKRLTFFKLNDKWYSIQDLLQYCKEERLRFYSEETGELDFSRMIQK